MEGSRGLVNLIWHYMASDAVKEKFNKRKESELEQEEDVLEEDFKKIVDKKFL